MGRIMIHKMTLKGALEIMIDKKDFEWRKSKEG